MFFKPVYLVIFRNHVERVQLNQTRHVFQISHFKSIASECMILAIHTTLTSEQVSTINVTIKNSKYSQPAIWSVAWGKEHTTRKHQPVLPRLYKSSESKCKPRSKRGEVCCSRNKFTHFFVYIKGRKFQVKDYLI